MSHDRINGMLRRCWRLLIDVTRPTVEAQIETLTDEVHTDVEVIETYGMTVYPPADVAEGLVVSLNGESDNGIVIAWRDPFYRPTDLEEGEVKFYAMFGQYVHFNKDGEVIIKDQTGSTVVLEKSGDIVITPSSNKTRIVSDLEITGNTTMAGTLDVNGTSVKHGGVNIGKTHVHTETGTTTLVPH